MIILFSNGCPNPFCAVVVAAPTQATAALAQQHPPLQSTSCPHRGQALPLRPRRGLAAGSGWCFCSQAAFLLTPCPWTVARLRSASPAGGLAAVGLAVGGWLWVAGPPWGFGHGWPLLLLAAFAAKT
ncbi:hypothetical protein BHE74_00050797 [Ensete ventricosum]|nr:hypothetical protein BHE74_00050797 [Ensete ventricosum]RZS22749.1 hypothetical protein BHM03_00055576 [Ensete ventricosum]